jgi:hypothetical protein
MLHHDAQRVILFKVEVFQDTAILVDLQPSGVVQDFICKNEKKGSSSFFIFIY